MEEKYRTYLHTDYGYVGKGTHNIKRTIRQLDDLIYNERLYDGDKYDYVLIVIEELQDIPVILKNEEEYEIFRRDHYENQIGNVPTKYKQVHRKN